MGRVFWSVAIHQRGHRNIPFTFKHVPIIIAVVTVIGAACLAYAYYIEPRRLVLNSKEIKIKGLNSAFDGFRIVAIGDIHGGSNAVNEDMLGRVVSLANEQNADIVVLLGDYVSHGYIYTLRGSHKADMDIGAIARELGGLRAKFGVLAVLGNHDGWHGDKKIADALTGAGIRVLQNEVTVIERGGARLRFFGTLDHLQMQKPWKETSSDLRAVAEASGGGDLIVLQHSPDVIQMVSGELSIADDLRLMIAAHTHGGQIWLPIIGRPGIPSSYGQRYAYGHIRENNVDLYVTSGIGTSVLPFRFMVPPEIAVLTLRSN